MIYNITTRKCPIWLTTDDFKIESDKHALVIIAQVENHIHPTSNRINESDYRQWTYTDHKIEGSKGKYSDELDRQPKHQQQSNPGALPYLKIRIEFRFPLRA